jgi:flagellar basal-body rod modification protein FlgD
MGVDLSALKSLGLTQSSSDTTTQKKNEMGQDMFMKLMVAQLKNQNPLKPQDGAEFLSQLAQFSTVTGIQGLQKSLDTFTSSRTEDLAVQASALVGKNVMIKSDTGVLGASGQMGGAVTVPTGATSFTVHITTANGAEVKTITMDQQSAGTASFTWDGTGNDGSGVPQGVYKIKAEAMVDGKNTALETQAEAPVESVSLGGDNGMEVDLGGLGKHPVKDILSVHS